ncbi:MAG: FHA domain-containing protein [bacterium]|nr:FHA domain-containing protein [bacterium]
MSPNDQPPETAYRLCGEIEGVFRSFLLSTPVARVGSHPGHDVVLPFSGVSREHAVLTAATGGLIVEDRGSKNGTLVNGDRVTRARLVPGDELTVGRATLVLEAVDDSDARLALVFDSEDPEPVPGDSRETDLLDSQQRGGSRPSHDSRLSFPPGFVAGQSAAIRGLYRELEMACGGDYPVLILGETGSGKELIAATLHRSSARAHKPLLAVNCAAIPADLLEAEMFGVVRGAATGVTARPGCFARARDGTLFLDEIGEMPAELQAKLLRVLESGEMQPVGGTPVNVDVRVLSATNVDVDQRVAKGIFRADLYYRLAASVITVPPLRARREDLPALIQHFVQTFAEELELRLRGLSQHALSLLMAYDWPGNVRELQHELRRIVQHALPGQTIDSSLLPEKIRFPATPPEPVPAEEPAAQAPDRSLDLRERVAEVEREVIQEALAQTSGLRRPAAKLLGISRNTLAAKITQYGLE